MLSRRLLAGAIALQYPTDLIYDTFARTDSSSSLGTTLTGETWTAHSGTWGIKNGAAYLAVQSGDSVATVDSSLTDVEVQCEFLYNNDGGIVLRAIDASNYVLALFNSTLGQVQLYKRVAGTYTLLGTTLSGVAPIGATYSVKLLALGSYIEVYVNGISRLTASVSDLATATRVGLRQNSTAQNRWYNFTCRALGNAPYLSTAKWLINNYSPGSTAYYTSRVKVFQGWANPAKEVPALTTGDRWIRSEWAARVPIILDTDLSTDVDDAFDVKCCVAYHLEGLADLLGVAVTTSRSKAPGCAAAICQHYGLSTPVASYAPLGTFDPGVTRAFVDEVYDNYTHTGVGLAASCTDSTTGIAAWLTASSGGVTYIMTGFAKGLRAFLESSPANLALFTSKVSRVVAVAGRYPSSGTPGEFNFTANPGDWNWLNANCPVPIVWAGTEIGDAMDLAGGPYLDARQGTSEIIRYAMTRFRVEVAGHGRLPWGVVGIVYAVTGRQKFFDAEIAGTNSINATTGENTFTPGAGSQVYLTTSITAGLKAEIESLIASDCVTGSKTWNGSAWV